MSKKTTRCLALMLTLVMVLGIVSPQAMAATSAIYTVEHYQQDINGQTYTLEEAEIVSGVNVTIVAASSKEYPGFTVKRLPAAALKSDGNTVLEVYYERNQYAVYFDVNGGVYMEPYAERYGASLIAPPNPTRAGYTFDGWTVTCDDEVTSSFPTTMPAGDLHLTAKWIANDNAPYTVVYWLENANEDYYDYVGSATQTGASDASVVVPNGILTGVAFPIASTYYARNTDMTDDANKNLAIAGDGSTIVNVYYDRNEYEIIFNDGGYGLTVDNHTYYYNTDPYSITAKFGANIADEWPTEAPVRENFTLQGWSDTLYIYTMMSVMDEYFASNTGPTTLTADFLSSSSVYTVTLYTMLQNIIDDDYSEKEGIRQTIAAVNSGTNEWFSDPIKGFTAVSGYKRSTIDPMLPEVPGVLDMDAMDGIPTVTFEYELSDKYDELYINYDRNEHLVEFFNGTGIVESIPNIKYEAPISEYTADTPPGKEDYTFDGWYTTEECYEGSKFDFDTTMPDNNLLLYAKWNPPEFTVTFNYANGEADTDQTVNKYDTVTAPDGFAYSGHDFAGWHKLDETTGELSSLCYVFDFPVNSNFTLVAKWTMSFVIRVEIQDENGDVFGELPEGNETLEVPGEVDENGKPIIDNPYDLEGYGVHAMEESTDPSIDYIVVYRPTSEEPEINPITKGDETVSGTGVPDAEVTVTFPGGTEVTTTVDKNGNWSALVPDGVILEKDDEVTTTQTELGKTESSPADKTVEDSAERDKSKRPVIDPIKEGGDTATGTGAPGAVIVVTFPDGSKATAVVGKDGKWTADVPSGVILKEEDEVTATQTEQGKTPSGPQIEVIDGTDPGKSDLPEINPITKGDETVSGTGVPGAEVTVTFPDDSKEITTVDKNGNWSVMVPDEVKLTDEDKVTAAQTEPDKNPSGSQIEVIDGIENTGESNPPPINTIYEGDKTVSGTGVPGAVIVVTFPDGSKATAVVGKDGKWTVDVTPGVTLKRTDEVKVTQTEPKKTVSDPSEKTVTYHSGNSANPPRPSPSPEPGIENKTSDGHVIGGGSGRDGGNPYDTIVIIGEGDVPLGSLIDDDHIKYLNGYPDGSVRAGSSITRGEAASIFYRLLKNTHLDGNASTTFSDVPSDSWYSLAISTLAELEVITGYPDGTFRPDNTITGAEFATLASRFDRLIITSGTAFSDVPETHWAIGYINSAYVKGWVDGYPDYSFKPEQSISRAEVVKTVNAMLNRNPDALPDDINPYNDITSAHWAYVHLLEASIVHNYERDENGIEYWTE